MIGIRFVIAQGVWTLGPAVVKLVDNGLNRMLPRSPSSRPEFVVRASRHASSAVSGERRVMWLHDQAHVVLC